MLILISQSQADMQFWSSDHELHTSVYSRVMALVHSSNIVLMALGLRAKPLGGPRLKSIKQKLIQTV